jgi:hypothetical protein
MIKHFTIVLCYKNLGLQIAFGRLSVQERVQDTQPLKIGHLKVDPFVMGEDVYFFL